MNRFNTSQAKRQIETVKNKRKQTSIQKYGVSHPSKNSVVNEKRKTTNLKKYGVNSTLAYVDTKEKIRQTCLEKYGVNNYMNSTDFKAKRKNSLIEHFGTDNISSIEEILQKTKNTNIEKRGVEFVLQDSAVRKKIEQTCLEKYGTQHHTQSSIFKKEQQKLFYQNLSMKLLNRVTPLFTVEEYESIEQKYQWKCNTCSNVFYDHLDNGKIPRCTQCYPIQTFSSIGENEVNSFIQQLGLVTQQNVRNIIAPLELDIFIPSENIAIEYCGLYWHAELSNKKNKNYHLNKLQRCQQQGIRLITIFEDEWLQKQDICKNRLIHILGLSKKLCFARQTNIKKVSSINYREFLNQTHIQGSINSSIRYGAYYKDQLVAVMGFGKRRKSLGAKSNVNQYELLRFSSISSIPGVASKLFTTFIREAQPLEITSYCDLRWGDGKLYKNLGFTLDYTTLPNYWYTKYINREHRYAWAKHVLVKKGYDVSQTEWAIMQSIGYDRIWDCGHLKFLWSS
jgi:hypothetical protein